MERQAVLASLARAHAALGIAAARLEVFATGAATLSDSLELVERGFEAGEIPLVDLLAARQRFVDAERGRLDAYAEYYRALADLEGAAAIELSADGSPDTGDAAKGGAQ